MWPDRKATFLSTRNADGVGIAQICLDRCDHDLHLESDEVDAGDGYPSPAVNHDALIEHAVQHVDERAAIAGRMQHGH